MIPIGWLIGGLLAGLVVVALWDEIVDWFKELIPQIKSAFSNIAHKAKVFAKKVKGSMIRVIYKLYYKQDNKWFEKAPAREVPESEVPAWVMEDVDTQETDITHPMEEELQMTLS